MSIKEEIDSKLYDLYRIYELYAWMDESKKITILFNDRKIIFYLFKERILEDEFYLSFSDKEDKLYEVVSLDLIKHVFNNNKIYKFGNDMYYNHDIKPYLSVIVMDDWLNNKVIDSYDKDEVCNIKGKKSSKRLVNTLDNKIKGANMMYRKWYQ